MGAFVGATVAVGHNGRMRVRRFALPAAPQAAAGSEAIEPGTLRAAFDRLASTGRFVLAEGAGGAGTPYGPDLLGLDLAGVLGLPVLLVETR